MCEDENALAKPEYATARIAVWWDMNDCPIPQGYDARRVRPSLERAFKKLGYSGSVFITAYGDQKQTPPHILQGLFSTGVCITHTIPESTCAIMFSDILDWRRGHSPPATMMLISNQVEDVFSWDLARLQQETTYNLFLAYSYSSFIEICSVLDPSAEWRWKKLLKSADEKIICRELPAFFLCKSCKFEEQSVVKFKKHLSSRYHALREVVKPTPQELDPVTRMWGRNYAAKPEYATAKIEVWWDMDDCPIPAGYDARRLRPSIEGAFKNLGYSGPVSITAYGVQTKTPDHVLRGLSSTGVAVAHTNSYVNYMRMFSDMLEWQNHNPPPATMMLISDHTEEVFAKPLAGLQQLTKYNLFLGYSYRPYKMSVLVTSAEWLWDSLLGVLETRRHVLQKCSETETGESTGMFYCKTCYCDCKGLDDFRKHLSSQEHALQEGRFIASKRISEHERQHWLVVDFPKRKRLRKAFRTGFRFHDYLHVTNHGVRRRARKSQTCKKEY